MKKTATKKTTKKKTTAKRLPPLVITVVEGCIAQNNQGVDPPKMSISGKTYPNQLQFQAVQKAWICVIGDDFTPKIKVPLRVEPGKPSRVFKLKQKLPPLYEVHYAKSCSAPCDADSLNGDAILIDP